MKNSLFKKALTFIVVAAMLVAVLAIPASAAGSVIPVHAVNAFNNDHADGVFLWTSETATTVDAIQNSAWVAGTDAPIFSWWEQALCTLSDGVYTVTAVSENGDDSYASWTVDANNIVLAAWNECTAAGAAEVFALAVGDTLVPDGALAAGVKFSVNGGVEDESSAPADDSEEPEEPAENVVINIPVFNRYENEPERIIGWDADDDAAWSHVEERYASNYSENAATFQWFDKIYLTYDPDTEKFVVTAVEGPGDGNTQYNKWDLNYGNLVLIAHYNTDIAQLPEYDLESYNNLVNVQVGDSFYFVGDYNATLSFAGLTPGFSLQSQKPDNYWVSDRYADDTSAEDSSVEDESSVEESSVEEESETETPDAGDSTSAIALIVLAVAAIAGSAVVIRKRG